MMIFMQSQTSKVNTTRQSPEELWLRFEQLSEQATIDLFREHVLNLFGIRDKEEMDSAMRTRLLQVTIHEARNNLKHKWQEALLENHEQLSEQPLVVEGSSRGNTVGVWLRYYLSNVGYNPVSAARRQEFLTGGSGLRVLSEEERKQLSFLINVLEFTKRDSTRPEELEEEVILKTADGRILILRDGVTEELDQELVHLAEKLQSLEQSENSTTRTLKDVFLGPEDERVEIRAIEERLIASKAVLKDALIEAVRTKQARQAHAVMKLIAQRGALFVALREYPEVGSGVREYIAKRFSQAAQVAFQGALEHPVHLRIALEVLYGDLLGSAPHDAARYAAQIEAVLVKSGRAQYRGMVIANAERAQFEWAPILDEHGELSLAV